jgi:hypothetical protein
VSRAGFGTLAIPVVGVPAAWSQLGERPSLVGALAIIAVGACPTGRRVARR